MIGEISDADSKMSKRKIKRGRLSQNRKSHKEAAAGQIGRRSPAAVDGISEDDGEYCVFRKFFVSKLLTGGVSELDLPIEALAAIGNPFFGTLKSSTD